MLSREKFDKFYDFAEEWEKKWNELEDIGIEVDVLTGEIVDRMLEELFYTMFPAFPRGDVVRYELGPLGDPEIHYMSHYDNFMEALYAAHPERNREELYNFLSTNYERVSNHG